MLHVVADHLWQSTVCVGIAWLLTLMLRRNSASVRFWVWCAASVKFLVPFVLLVMVGERLPWRPSTPPPAPTPVAAFALVSQPFSAAPAVIPAQASTAVSDWWTSMVTALPAIWAGGALIVLAVWLVRWRRLRAVTLSAPATSEGAEYDALRRLIAERGARMPTLRVTSGLLEPAIVGVWSPTLLWPAHISQRLTPPQIDAIIAHEVAHLTRRDNALALLHMCVEALFWFHPAVWFIGVRLVHEREHACDEAVVAWSGARDTYAEGILRTCEHCLESSLTCASGVTGSDLKARVAAIMRGTTQRLGLLRTALVAACALVLTGLPLLAGLMSTPTSTRMADGASAGPSERTFDVASIRLNRSATQEGGLRPLLPGGRLEASAVSVKTLVRVAYGEPTALLAEQVVGGPSWFSDELFDLAAKAETALTFDTSREMLRTLLRDRFSLTLSRETRQRPVLALSLAGGTATGPGLRASTASCATADGGADPQQWSNLCGVKALAPGRLRAERVTLTFLAGVLSGLPSMHLPVLDQTGLKDEFDVDLAWDPDPSGAGAGPALPTALKEQLGLRLAPAIGPVEYLVVTHVTRPSMDVLEPERAGNAVQNSAAASPAARSTAPGTKAPAEPLASIKPSLPDTPNRVRLLPGGRLEATGVYVRQLITLAFEIQPVLLASTPAWTEKEHFDISAKFGETSEDVRKAGAAMLAMLRDLLRTRFQLTMHKEVRELPAYVFRRTRDDGALGEHFRPSTRDCTVTNVFGDGGARPCGVFGGRIDNLVGDGVDLDTLSKMLSGLVERPVVNRTGLTGTFDVELSHDSDRLPANLRDSTKPNLFTAIKEQWGLELKSSTEPIEVTVVDRVERPTEN